MKVNWTHNFVMSETTWPPSCQMSSHLVLLLVDDLEIDLPAAFTAKLTANAAKYPVSNAKGSSQVHGPPSRPQCLGWAGLDVNDSVQKYRLQGPGAFSGLHLVGLFALEQDIGFDAFKEYAAAQALHGQQQGP